MTCGLLIYFVDNNYISYFQPLLSLRSIKMDGWLGWGAKLTAIVGVKTVLNIIVPGSAAVVDFVQAGYDLIQGDKVGAGINAISGVAELVTFGFEGYIKELMKRSGKAGAVSTVRDLAMQSPGEASKKLGQQLSKFIASGGIHKEVLREHTMTPLISLGHQGLKGLISSGGHDIGKNVGGSIYEQFLKDVFERTIQTKMHTAFQFQLAADAAKRAARKELKKNYRKLLATEYAFAAAKGGITWRFKRNDSERN